MKNEITNKEFFIRYGIFVAIIVVLFGILIFPIKASQKTWTKSLRSNIEFVLDEREPNGWSVENSIPINNPFYMNTACFNARNRSSGELYKVIIIRIQTLYGPLPGVFLIDNNMNVEFVGFSSLHGRIANQIKENKKSVRIEYWKRRIPDIIFD